VSGTNTVEKGISLNISQIKDPIEESANPENILSIMMLANLNPCLDL